MNNDDIYCNRDKDILRFIVFKFIIYRSILYESVNKPSLYISEDPYSVSLKGSLKKKSLE